MRIRQLAAVVVIALIAAACSSSVVVGPNQSSQPANQRGSDRSVRVARLDAVMFEHDQDVLYSVELLTEIPAAQ